jgi:vitamin B12 transporter
MHITLAAAVRPAALAALVALPLSPLRAIAQPSASQSVPDALEEVIVTSSRIPTPLREVGAAVSVISADEIELRGYSSMADILRTQPGIGVSNSGGGGKVTAVRIRGEESYRTLVMIDGVEMSDPTGPQVGPDFSNLVTTSDIERVEVLRGPQGFIYGADAGGVVNIRTRTGQGAPATQLGVELGEFASRKLDANFFGGSERGDYFVSITDLKSDGFNSRADDSVLMDDDGFSNTTLHTKLGWNVNDALRLQFVARDIDAATEFDSCGFPTTHDCLANSEQTTFRVSADFTAGSTTHAFAYSQSSIARDNFASGVSTFSTSGDLTQIEYTGSFAPTDVATLIYGLDLRKEDIVGSDGNNISRDQRAAYFEIQRQFGENVFVTAGARRDDNDEFGAHDSVRTTAAYVQTLPDRATIKYRIGYGTGFRAPSLSELAYNAGPFAFPPASGVQLKEESSDGYDVGLTYVRDGGLSLELTYFDQNIVNEIYFDLSGFSGYLQSLGTANSRGIEFGAQVPLNNRWTLFANSTWNETQDTAGMQRIRRPEKIGNFGLGYATEDSRLRLLANLRVSRDSVDEVFGVGRVPLADYEVLDLSGSYLLTETLEVFGRIENAANEDYAEVIGFLTGGTAVSAGIRKHF